MLTELRQALAIDPLDKMFDADNYTSVKYILECCLGLVTVDEESSSIRLVHYSIQEYIGEHRQDLFPDAEFLTTESCLTFLSLGDFKGGKCNNLSMFDGMIHRHPFLLYAAQYWGHHAILLNEDAKDALNNQIITFAKLEWNSTLVEQAFHAKLWYKDPSHKVRHRGDWERWYEEIRELQTPLHIASRWGLQKLVRELLSGGVNINARNSRGETALWWATRNGHVTIAEMLLDAHAEPNLPDSKYGETPLIVATALNHKELVQLLLDHKAECNTGDYFGETALYKAKVNENENILEMIREVGGTDYYADSDGLQSFGARLLLRAERAGQIDVICTPPTPPILPDDKERMFPSPHNDENDSDLLSEHQKSYF